MSDIRFNQWLHQSGTGGVTQLSSGHVGIGTTNPLIPVHSGNNAVLNVGVVTANNIYAGTLNGTLALSDISGITGSFTSDLTVNGPNLDISDKIRHIGDTNTAIRFPANDTITFETGSSEKFRIGSDGQIGLSGQNYGTAGQVLTSQGSGSAVQWATPSLPTLPHAFVFMDSQYFTSSVTLLEFNNSTTNDRSSGVTITRGGSERFTPTVAGTYFVQAHLTYSHGGGVYTPVVYIYRNGSSYSSLSSSNIVNYGGGHNDSLSCQAMMTFNGTSDYVDMRASHNGGGNATMKSYSTFAMFRVGA